MKNNVASITKLSEDGANEKKQINKEHEEEEEDEEEDFKALNHFTKD